MNAAARSLAPSSFFVGDFSEFRVSRISLTTFFLLTMVILTSLSLIYLKNYQRVLTSELQAAYTMANQLQIERSQLMLEQSTWATPGRVSHVAQTRLEMTMPQKINYLVE